LDHLDYGAAAAFFHSALSLALDDSGAGAGAGGSGGSFAALPARASAAVDPLLTEPFWSGGLGVALLQRDAPWVDGAVLAAGALATAAAAAGASALAAFMDRRFKVA
jgi:hypothetical protein